MLDLLSKRTHLLLLLLLVISCTKNADRDNPLDPRSVDYATFGSVEGHVYTYYAPFQPIASALITLVPGNQTTTTNQAGAFAFANVSPDSYLLTVAYPGYAPDTAEVLVQSNKTTAVQFNLDGLPQLDTLALSSGFQHEHYPFEAWRMIDVTAKVSDPDGPADIKSVAIIIPSIDFRDTLGISLVIGTYQAKIEEKRLSINHLEQLVGQPVFIEITDRAGKCCRYGPKYLFRVIADEPEIVSPRNSALVGFQPTLKWKPVQLLFSFTFKVEIYAISDDQILYPAIYTISGISSDISEFQLGTILPAGLYLWIISIVDNWGNWSRSKLATFQVGA